MKLQILAFVGSLAGAFADVWPMPTESSFGSSTVQLSNKLKFHGAGSADAQAAIDRYSSLMFPHNIDFEGDAMLVQGEFTDPLSFQLCPPQLNLV